MGSPRRLHAVIQNYLKIYSKTSYQISFRVTFTARSPVSNDTAACRFKIHVIGKTKILTCSPNYFIKCAHVNFPDLEAPRVQGCPTSFEVRLNPGETSREMWWSEPKFTDNVKLHYVQQSHNPGLLMTDGTTHINYVAGDAEGNKARCSFSITVHGTYLAPRGWICTYFRRFHSMTTHGQTLCMCSPNSCRSQNLQTV